MRERDEPPVRIGHGKQARRDRKHRRRWVGDARERLSHRLRCFLRSQAGQRWADILPRLDERLRAAQEDRCLVIDARRWILDALVHDRRGHRRFSVSGGNLAIEEGSGVLRFVPHNRKRRRLAVTFCAAELRTEPELIR